MARTLFLCLVVRKFSEITDNKPIFSQYNNYYNYEYFFFQSAFWSLFNCWQRSQLNQKQCSLCCSSHYFLALPYTQYGTLQCFSAYFRKLKKLEFYGLYFQTMLFLVTMIRLEHHLLACARAIASIKWIRLLWFCHSVTTNLISSASFHFILKSKSPWAGDEVASQRERKVLPFCVVESVG